MRKTGNWMANTIKKTWGTFIESGYAAYLAKIMVVKAKYPKIWKIIKIRKLSKKQTPSRAIIGNESREAHTIAVLIFSSKNFFGEKGKLR